MKKHPRTPKEKAKMRKGKLPIMKPSTETPPKPVVIYSGVKKKIKPKKKAK